MKLCCGECGITDVRLYRPYGECRRPERDRCNACVPDEYRGWYVPLVPAEDGTAWGYTSVPDEAAEQWYGMPEASAEAPEYLRNGGWYRECEGCGGEGAMVVADFIFFEGMKPRQVRCPLCDGLGRVIATKDGRECPDCGGMGGFNPVPMGDDSTFAECPRCGEADHSGRRSDIQGDQA